MRVEHVGRLTDVVVDADEDHVVGMHGHPLAIGDTLPEARIRTPETHAR
jgi:hypothetical protein